MTLNRQAADKAVQIAVKAVSEEINGRHDNGWRAGKPLEDPEKTKRWGFVTAKPSEYLVHIRRGQVRSRSSGQGATCFKWPFDSVAVIPTTLQRLYFTADQVTREKVGVQVKGLAVYRIARPELAVRMLNFSYPERAQQKLAETLTDMFVGAARRLIANLSVEDCLAKRKEALAAFLISEIAPVIGGAGRANDATDKGWGVVLDTIEVQDVRVLSEKVFSDMQAPFRNSLSMQARASELERMRETEIKEAEARRAIEEAKARAEAEMRELKARAETEAASIEHAESMKQLAIECEADQTRLVRTREAAHAKLEADVEAKKQAAEAVDLLVREAAARKAALRMEELRQAQEIAQTQHAESMKRIALAAEQEKSKLAIDRETAAERFSAQVETKAAAAEADARLAREAALHDAERQMLEMQKAQEISAAKAAQDLADAEAEATVRAARAEAERKAAAAELAAALERAKAERVLETERAAMREGLKALELRVARAEGELKNALALGARAVENQLSPERVQMELIAKGLPELARVFQQRFGEVKILATGDQNPFAFLVQAVESAMDLARRAGLGFPALKPGDGHASLASPKAPGNGESRAQE